MSHRKGAMMGTSKVRKSIGKQVATGALALTLGAGMMVPAGLAFGASDIPDGQGKITINKDTTQTNDVAYKGFQVFRATQNEDGSVSNIRWGADDATATEVRTAVEAIIKGHDPDYAGKTAQDAAEWINAHVTGTDQTTIVDADSIANEIAAAVDGLTETVDVTPDTATTVDNGYWLFVTASVDTKTDTTGTSPIFTIIGKDKEVTVTEKTSVPTVKKEIKEDSTGEYGKAADSQMGQAVDYKLTGTVSNNIATYDKYYYKFNDRLTTGLTLDVSTVKVEVGGIDVTSQATISPAEDAAGANLEVTFEDLKALKNGEADLPITADTKIVVTYQAALNANAVVGNAGNPNEVYIDYSNNPNTDDKGKSTPDDVTDYTYALKINKVDRDTGEDLSNAKFTIKVTDADDQTSIGKFVQVDGSLGDTAYEFVTSTDGIIAVQGLDAGTYTIHETAAPEHYQTTSDFTVTITPTLNQDTGAITNLAASHAGNADVSDGIDGGALVTVEGGEVDMTLGEIKNVNLPLTGQQGIMILTAAGIGIIGISVASLIRRRKSEGDAE